MVVTIGRRTYVLATLSITIRTARVRGKWRTEQPSATLRDLRSAWSRSGLPNLEPAATKRFKLARLAISIWHRRFAAMHTQRLRLALTEPSVLLTFC